MNFHQLHIFDVVARNRSFSKAANELYLSQPTVSVHLQKLEQELGLELFEQLGRNIYLTDAGQILYSYTQKIFALADEAQRSLEELQGLHKGRIRLGASTTPGIYYLPKFLAFFKEKLPGIEIVLDVTNTSDVERKILCNQLDIGIVGHRSEEPDLICEPFLTDRLMLILSSKNPLAAKEHITVEDLASQRFIMREPGSSTRRAIEEAFARRGIRLQVSLEYASTDGIKYAVAANLGVSIVSEQAVLFCHRTGLVEVRPLPELDIQRDLCLVYHKHKHLSPLAKTLMSEIKTYATTAH